MSEPGGPVDEGEIMYVDGTRGMLNTKGKQALSFDVKECRGFVPAERNRVAIARIEGMQAFGLSLLSDGVPVKYVRPVVPAGRVDALMRETPDARGSESRLTAHVLRARMPSITWSRVFSQILHRSDGLALDDLAAELERIQRPFERDEIEEILAFDPELTHVSNPLNRIDGRWPSSWLAFASWSNGGDFATGDRTFDMFSLAQIREFTTLYGITVDLEGAIPFAMDGGAALYMFDTRRPPTNGEYPIVFCHCSEVGDGWDGVIRLESSFLACCQSAVDPSALR